MDKIDFEFEQLTTNGSFIEDFYNDLSFDNLCENVKFDYDLSFWD